MTVSIIIAVKAYCENLRECVSRCRELEFEDEDYEILILSDTDTLQNNFKDSIYITNPLVRIIATRDVTPPYKRDIGAKHAKGQILAFLDDDAYPPKQWLGEAVDIFNSDENIACVCGPAVTPLQDSFWQKASGLVYSSHLVSGNHRFRYMPQPRREVFDFPSCNFLIRRDVFDEVGGFDKPFWPGEDTFLCLKVLDTGRKMIYDPAVLVFHHRRPLFKKHLVQIKNYAYHRGYFAKKYPKTSCRLEYFIPSFFAVGVIAGAFLSLFSSAVKALYLTVLIMYISSVIVSTGWLILGVKESGINKIRLFLFVCVGIILTHLTYGLYFIRGLTAPKMPEEQI